MSISLTALQSGVTLSSAAAPICTATATAGTVVTSVVFSNTNSGVLTITAYLVRSGDAAGTGNILIPSQTLAPSQTYVAPEFSGRSLAAGDAIWGLASVNGVVNCIVDGFTITNDEAGSNNVIA